MTCTALFQHGQYFKLLTKDCEEFWHLDEKILTCRWDDGRFEIYRIPPHDFSVSGDPDADGASLPMIARALRPSLRERMLGAALAHDASFHKRLQVKRDGQWVPANLSLEDSNELLKALMFIEAVTDYEREIVFDILQIFGKRAYDEDAKAAALLSPGLPSPGG